MATTTNFGWETPDDTDLVKDGALAMRTLGNAIDASLVDLKGGTTGQVLSKTSNTDMDFTWVTSDDANAIQNAIVDAKGDLIAASAADTPARLAVGNNGETLVADSSTSTGLRYNPQNALANPIINGGMDIWQRGTSISVSASTVVYTLDRWTINAGANQAFTVSRQATGDTTNLPNIQYCARFQRNSGQTGTGQVQIQQSIETTNAVPFAGKTVTVSFYARAGANYSPTSSLLNFYLISGTGTDQSRANTSFTGEAFPVSNQNATLTTTWQRFAFTGTIGATATELSVWFGMTPTGTASTNDFFEVTGVQIDVGTYTASSAPTFRRSGGTLVGELAACQRYYWRNTSGETLAAMSASMPAGSTTEVDHPVVFPVPMRVRPTSLDYSGLSTYDGTTNYTTGTYALIGARSGTQFATVRYTHGSGALTQYRPYQIIANSSATAYIGLSAEL